MRRTLRWWVALILCVMCLASSGIALAKPPADRENAAGETADDTIVPVSLPEGIALARQSATPMFVMLTRQTCGNCNNLKSRIAAEPNVKDLLQKYVVVDVDVDGPLARQWQSRFPAPGQTLPFVYLVAANGEGIQASSGVVRGDDLPNMLKDGLTKADEIHQAAGLVKKKKKRLAAKAKDDSVAKDTADGESSDAESSANEAKPADAKVAKAPPKPRTPAKVDPLKQAASSLKLAQSFAEKRPEKAIKYAEQVIELAPGSSLAADAKKLLESLK